MTKGPSLSFAQEQFEKQVQEMEARGCELVSVVHDELVFREKAPISEVDVKITITTDAHE